MFLRPFRKITRGTCKQTTTITYCILGDSIVHGQTFKNPSSALKFRALYFGNFQQQNGHILYIYTHGWLRDEKLRAGAGIISSLLELHSSWTIQIKF